MLFVVKSEDSDWIAWLYPSPYTAVFMWVDVYYNFFENDVV